MVNTPIENCAIVILAAGASSRFGSPKQLLAYKGKSLLRHAVDVALETGCQAVYVVLGANIELMRNDLKEKPVILVENKGWKEGMASSIRCGVEHVMKKMLVPEHIIFMVCDQPYVTSSLLLKLMEKKKETRMLIVACSYGNNTDRDQIGIPVLFHQNFFPALLELEGDKGARKLIMDNPGKVAMVPFPEGVTDIDTESDYELLKKRNDD